MFGSDAKVTAAMTNAKEFARVNYKNFQEKLIEINIMQHTHQSLMNY